MKNILCFVILTVSLVLQPLWAANINTSGGIAINGYDPVSYFTGKGPLPGSDSITYEWMEATWRFVSEENRAAFTKDPQRYAPQYGGYCAYAVSQGSTASVHPYAYSIDEGKLYLNFSKDVNNRWLIDREKYIRQGDANWPRLNH